jgi:hypothetical protein
MDEKGRAVTKNLNFCKFNSKLLIIKREAINVFILQLKEDGSLARLKEKWWKQTSECENKESEVSTKVRLGILFHTFFIVRCFSNDKEREYQ